MIGLYRFHSAAPCVAYADAIRDSLDEGLILMVGISNCDRGPDRRGERDPGRSSRVGPEQVLTQVPLQPAPVGALPGVGYSVPAMAPAVRDREPARTPGAATDVTLTPEQNSRLPAA
ncbi:hypothetical protein [Streptomyces sp. NPDC101149]|uniref:hypothetical protein n=1 Tax=Streptomyces sp. NPDC101149 TaxID=3366113 RepID=UPI00382D3873